MSFLDDAVSSVGKAFKGAAKGFSGVLKFAKPVAAGVAIVYPPAAPVAAGIFVADKALDAAQPPPKPGSKGLTALVAAAQAAQQRAQPGKPPAPAHVVEQAIHKKFEARRAAGHRIIKNTFEAAAKGDHDAARGATLLVKRAAARREAARWRIRGGRIVRVS